MTEVREEKSESSSKNIGGETSDNKSSGENMDEDVKEDIDRRICHLCGRIFKNERARKTHERYCKSNGKEEEYQEGDGDIVRLREELRAEMEALKDERRKLVEERRGFREEIDKLKEKRMLSEAGEGYTPPTAEENKRDFNVQPRVETATSISPSGVIVLEAEEESSPEDEGEELEEIEKELETIEPEIAKIGMGPSKSELEDLSRELEAIESELTTKVDFTALTKMSEDYENSLKRMEESVAAINRKIDGVIQEMEESGRRYGTYQNMVREMKRLDEKTNEILEEIGFGESLNVGKIPPNILESVYESTMEDVIGQIRSNYGTQDAENIIIRTLEDIRTRTSGSELFYFDGRMLKTRNLAKVIQNKLISAKQVQTTYAELLRKFLEYLPGYKAKNFRAMIKLKSQEYAVDKTTHLLDKLDDLTVEIGDLNEMVKAAEERQNTIEFSLTNLMESNVERDDLEKIQTMIEEIKAGQGELEGVLAGIKEKMEEDNKAFSGEFERLSRQIKEPEGRISQKGKKGIKKPDKKEKVRKGGEELSVDELIILGKIPERGFTLSRIKKEIGDELDEERIEECLQSLIDQGVMSTVKRGRHTIYLKKENEENINEGIGGEK
jgi:DNA repair exonuclease SbcCD ATPase subunit